MAGGVTGVPPITEAPYADVAEREHRPCGLCVVIRKAGHAKPGRGRGAERMRGEVTESPLLMLR